MEKAGIEALNLHKTIAEARSNKNLVIDHRNGSGSFLPGKVMILVSPVIGDSLQEPRVCVYSLSRFKTLRRLTEQFWSILLTFLGEATSALSTFTLSQEGTPNASTRACVNGLCTCPVSLMRDGAKRGNDPRPHPKGTAAYSPFGNHNSKLNPVSTTNWRN